ncbi:RmlC-like jelly roll fold [Moorella glycerini]|uniref:HTH-type transcriptional regulator PuuR n=1 Tax=Neomoorella stamsii TaxID=1266720 RepID=A0A9X7J3U3_9FIRM|nr:MULTISPECIES: cupin domain-containing protein [Moorella]PRR73410.1 HTH-type transcriptional regulator PuuR [Moorella stamsii]CEP69179.1 RmlC-like jelly roll fold [Moorella glycerini]
MGVNNGANETEFARSEAETLRRLGENIRSLRQEREMTLARISDLTGLSVSMLSMVERGEANPSIGTLVAIANALGVSLSDLFDDGGERTSKVIIRRAEQTVFQTKSGVVRRILLHDLEQNVEVAENIYEPGTSSSDVPTRHRGREYGVIIEGQLRIWVGDSAFDAFEGDAVSIDSGKPHRFENIGDSRTRTLWINIYR